ncbi:MAG TPA: FtsX-like permease family protein [Bacteroides sp.]|nr:FtsX-like permease family protein [Bacteroides sp.]
MKTFRLIIESFLFAFKSVIVNKMRTVLSLLGITIGIFAIISVFTIFDSLEINIRESLSGLGENTVYIQKWPWAPEAGEEYEWWQYWNRPVPKYREYLAIKERSQLSEVVAFFAFSRRTLKYKNNSVENIVIWGTTPEFEQAQESEVLKGRFFTEYEFQASVNLVILGYNIADRLFQNDEPIGKVIKIRGHKATVIGVFAKEGSSMFGSMDDFVVVPMQFIRKITDIRKEGADPRIAARGKVNVSNEELMDELRSIMRSSRRLSPRANDNFAMNRTSMLTGAIDQIFKILNVAGFFIGIFSILVGGFGIANIMFVSVKERTNIIGIQKALGAKRYFILTQFLFESMLLAVTGGIVGLLIVFTGASIMSALIDSFKVFLTAGNIFLGIGISASIGIISGFAPAWSAAKMDPVEAINTSF